ncbi:MAG: DUF305 domain-containing protein, partial [Gemmatimonadaceae bacterium]|nr:DUF305 domain-containing protein [Gloeobacterales cyanobacterium ES-bin-141]
MKRSIVFTVLAAAVSLGIVVGGTTRAHEGQGGSSMPMGKPSDMKGMHGKNMDMSMVQDLGPADARYDLRFINAMLEHHTGALTMAQDALSKSKRPEIQQLAREIVEAQQKEITQMKAYRQ